MPLSADFETILYEQDGPVVTITMNRPERKNAMTNRMVRETGDALAYAAEDRDVRVLVLTGAGTSFCPGADLQAVAGGTVADEPLTPSDFRAPVLVAQRCPRSRSPRSTARARVPGSDGRVRATSGSPRRRRGSTPRSSRSASPATWADRGRSSRIVGPARARELYMLPAKFDAAEALRIGLVTPGVRGRRVPG